MTEYKKAQIICELIQQQQTPTEQIKAEFKRLLASGYIIQGKDRLYAINKH